MNAEARRRLQDDLVLVKDNLGKIQGADLVRRQLDDGLTYHQAVERYGRLLIEIALADAGYNKTLCGKRLGLTRESVRRIVERTPL